MTSDSYTLFALPIEREPAHLGTLVGTDSRTGSHPDPDVRTGATASELAFHPDPSGRREPERRLSGRTPRVTDT